MVTIFFLSHLAWIFVCTCSYSDPQAVCNDFPKPSRFVILIITFADLFAEEDKSKKSVKSKKKKTKKSSTSTTKDLSMFDDNARSIFDNPLSAMGASPHS